MTSTRRIRPAPYSCAACDARWHGLNAAHCPTCHHTFGSESAFDLHRGPDCRDPATVPGLLPVQRPGYTMWITERSDDTLWGDFD